MKYWMDLVVRLFRQLQSHLDQRDVDGQNKRKFKRDEDHVIWLKAQEQLLNGGEIVFRLESWKQVEEGRHSHPELSCQLRISLIYSPVSQFVGLKGLPVKLD